MRTPAKPLVNLLLFATVCCTSLALAQDVTLTYWNWFVTQDPAVEAGIAAFEAANPNINIEKETIAFDQYSQSLSLALQSGSGPDLISLPLDPSYLNYVEQGYLLDLAQFEDAEAFMQSFPEPQLNFVEGSNLIGGALYSAPFAKAVTELDLYVNTNLYEAAGLVDESGEPLLPTTWEEMVENSRVITEMTNGYGAGFSLQQAWAAGWWLKACNFSGTHFDVEGSLKGFDFRTGEFTFASNPCYQEVLSGLVSMADEGLIHPDSLNLSVDDEGARALFAVDQIAHLPGGVWVIPGWEQTNPDFSAFTATHLPLVGAEEPASFFRKRLGGWHLGVNADTEHPEAAWEFFKFFYSEAFGATWAENGNGLLLNTPEPYDAYASNAAFEYIFSSSELTRTVPEKNIRNPALSQLQITLVGPSPEDILVGVLTGQITDIPAALADLDARYTRALETAIEDAQAAGLEVSIKDLTFPDFDPAENYITRAQE